MTSIKQLPSRRVGIHAKFCSLHPDIAVAERPVHSYLERFIGLRAGSTLVRQALEALSSGIQPSECSGNS